jgi:hypothetical protein
MRGGGLGLIDPNDYRKTARTGRAASISYDPNDRWHTGRRGLPGTIMIRVGPTGHAEGLVGAGLGIVPLPPFVNRTLSDAYMPAFPGSSVDDFSLARMYQYQPVESGWVHVKELPVGPTGLGQAPPLTPDGHDKSYTLQVVTTLAISTIALAGVVTFVQGQLDRRRRRSR